MVLVCLQPVAGESMGQVVRHGCLSGLRYGLSRVVKAEKLLLHVGLAGRHAGSIPAGMEHSD